jgi:HEAT repeat protein
VRPTIKPGTSQKGARVARVWLAAIGTAVVLLAAWAATGWRASDSARVPAQEGGLPDAQGGASGRPAGTQRHLQVDLPYWQEGITTTFSFRQDTSVRQDSGESMIAFSLAGELEIARISKEHLRFAFKGKLSNLVAGAHTTGLDGDVQKGLEREFERPFFARVPLEGGADVLVNREVSPFVVQNWRSLVGNLQFTSPRGSEARWTSTEAGPLGECEFTYTRGDRGEVTKQASQCKQPGGGEPIAYSNIDLERVFGFAGSGRLDALSVDETVGTEKTPLAPAIRSQSQLSLKRTAQRVLPDRERSALADAMLRDTVDGAAASEAALELELERARIGNRQFSGVMAALVSAQKQLSDQKMRDKYEREYVALVAILRVEPTQHLAAIKEHVLTGGPLQTALIAALQDCGTEVAHAAMRELLRSSELGRDAKMELARGLSLTPQPSPTSVAALRELKSDPTYGPQAVYGLGANAFKLKQSNPELRADVTRELVHELDNSTSPDDQLVRLIALGNAGPDDALTSIGRMMGSTSENLRAAAATALRRITQPGADEMLAVLLNDPSPVVRASALRALAERAPTEAGLLLLGTLCAVEPEFRVRALAVQLAARWLPRFPALGPVLSGVAEADTNADLRTIARNALADVSKSG